jgi:hypothetical protein
LLIFKLKVHNGTNKRFDPGAFQVNVSYGTERRISYRVFYGHAFDRTLTEEILAGHVGTELLGYVVPTSGLSDVVVSVTPDYDYKPLSWGGRVS